ncbi:vacuolar transporter chaperone [Entomortierella beljakovae]|nr:vacuolar transporter chaperone [Entomortierella beljakovae]
MKFGSELKKHQSSHWRYHYIDYDGLKAHLKSKSHQREYTEQDESHFVKLLNDELEKVASFQSLKLGEVQRRTEHCEYTIQQLQQPSGKPSEKLTLASFVETESEINKITQDLQDLAKFQRLNYTAFLKIIKKHDKHTGFTLRAYFMNQQLNNQPFHKENFAAFVSRLSCLYNIVRTGNPPTPTTSQFSYSEKDEELEHPGCKVMKSSYWVHPDCLMDLKMLILKYLPLVVYEPTPALNSSHKSTSQLSAYISSESPVSTIYLDNPDFDLYMGQLEQQKESETVRLRWYGSEKKQMWVEYLSKNASSPTTTTTATAATASATPSSLSASVDDQQTIVKHRFQIKSKYVPKLVQGEANMNKAIDQMRRSGQKSEAEISHFEEQTKFVQSRIKDNNLQPVSQTFFNRTAFQVPGDARVRITIDSDVVMVREKKIVSSDLYERPWDPVDLQADQFPFQHIPEYEIVRFPYSIMQIRTLTDPQEEIPTWVDHIAQSHLVEMVPNFAKDLHAIATLYESRVGLLPFWLSDMDRDIRKPALLSGGFRLSTPNDSHSNSGSNDTLSSGHSTVATTISEDGQPSSSSAAISKNKRRSRKDILNPNEIYTPNVTFDEEVQDLEAMSRAMVERQDGKAALKAKKPVVSCLKKNGSFSSRNSSLDDLASARSGSISDGYGSTTSSISSLRGGSRRSKRVTFERNTAKRWWDEVASRVPFVSKDIDLEAQYRYVSNGRGHIYRSLSRFFWTSVSLVNIGLLFVGLVLSLMNLGDSVGLEAASMFLVVSCICMGTTVWAHLERMNGGEIENEGYDNEVERAQAYVVNNKAGERTGLLSPRATHSHAVQKGRWIRTRFIPIVMLLSLGAVVGLNAIVRIRPSDDGVGAD